MSDKTTSQTAIPVLTDIVADRAAEAKLDRAALIAELQTQLASSAYTLTAQVLHAAFAEMEATLFEQVSTRLRRELPELIDRILREHLTDDPDES
ncbi:MAG TPA: hypothetical protein VLD39_06730 [Gammaproteobacteria bacterium]|nr:hypothetical protein [Gammaproteobacteria bacterium]